MQTVWKGSISFGLLNVPVRMSTATARESVSFRTLHKKCHTPLKQKRFCPNCDTEVEYEENKFIIISDEDDEDLESIPFLDDGIGTVSSQSGAPKGHCF